MMRQILFLLALLAQPALADTLIIGNKGEDSVSFVDLATGREIARRETASMPHEVAVSPDGKRAAVVAYGGKTIDVFDVAGATLIERIDLGTNLRPHGLLWLADGRMIATTEGSDSLTVVLANAPGAPDRVSSIKTGQKGSHMVAVRDLDTAYVANMQSGSVSVIDLDGQRPVRHLPAGVEPEGIALTPDGKLLWVTDRRSDMVRVFTTSTLEEITRVATGKTPIRVVISPNGRSAVTSNYGSGDLTVIDVATRKLVRTIKVSGQSGFNQVTILFSTKGDRLYVAETGIDRIAEIDFASGKILGRLPAGKNGDGLAISSVATQPD